jgi:hypothetical protein
MAKDENDFETKKKNHDKMLMDLAQEQQKLKQKNEAK